MTTRGRRLLAAPSDTSHQEGGEGVRECLLSYFKLTSLPTRCRVKCKTNRGKEAIRLNRHMRRGLTVLCALALAAGSAVAASTITTRTLQAQYADISLEVSGQKITLTDAKGNPVEPFAVDGTVYIPARALGDILGKEVLWDASTHTVSVGKAPLMEDAETLISAVEGSHPAFLLNRVPEGYAAARQAMLDTAGDPASTAADFAWSALAYTASLRDGHTSINPFGNGAQALLDIGWAADGGHLYLTDETGAVTETEVTAIGGLPVSDVFSAVDKYFAAENQSARDLNHAYWAANKNLLFKAGAAFSEDFSGMAVTVDGEDRTVAFAVPDTASAAEGGVVSTERKGGVFYVDLNQCVLGEAVDAAAAELAQAVMSGTNKVIIDVRGNGGGSSDACLQLLHAMDMEAPAYGGFVRYSELALDQYQPYKRGYAKTEGSDVQAPDLSTAKANPKIKLVVLTDENTYSSATMLGVWVQDGKLGTVIGRPSSNAPSSYGDILYFMLDNIAAQGTVSHVRWQRPDTNADQETLVPDVETAVGEDALQAALDYLAR